MSSGSWRHCGMTEWTSTMSSAIDIPRTASLPYGGPSLTRRSILNSPKHLTKMTRKSGLIPRLSEVSKSLLRQSKRSENRLRPTTRITHLGSSSIMPARLVRGENAPMTYISHNSAMTIEVCRNPFSPSFLRKHVLAISACLRVSPGLASQLLRRTVRNVELLAS
jgi:hypothetical protein